MKQDDNFDPTPGERVYYRSSTDGQRAYMVRRNGRDVLRLDRNMEELIRELDGSWVADQQIHPINAQQLAFVAFEADRALRKVMGRPNDKKTDEWLSLKEKARLEWISKGPDTGDIREDLYDAIMGTLRSLAGG